MSSRSKGVMKEEFRASKICRVMVSPSCSSSRSSDMRSRRVGRSAFTNSENRRADRSRFSVSRSNSSWDRSSFGINQRMRASTFAIRLSPSPRVSRSGDVTGTRHPGRRRAGRIVASSRAEGAREGAGSYTLAKMSVITKDLLKAEIDNVPEENLGVLYKIVKALEEPREEDRPRQVDAVEWKAWIAEIYGSMADAPIERG